MTFADPWLLMALAALPLLWWLLRATPPTPRTLVFPPLRLLLGLEAAEETPAHTPWWLLLLRMIAAGLVIIALAQPLLGAGALLPGQGPVLLVLDNGWASAADWRLRMQAAAAAVDIAERQGRLVSLLPTARDDSATPPAASAPQPAGTLRPLLATLQPKPWPPDRAAAAQALQAWRNPGTAVVYIGDGLRHDSAFAAFDAAMGKLGPVREICCAEPMLMQTPALRGDALVATVTALPVPAARDFAVLARTGDGRGLARAAGTIAPGATRAEAAIHLPLDLRNQLTTLVLDGSPSAASTILLDESLRRHPVGLVTDNPSAADTPLTGVLYYVRRALAPSAEIQEGPIAALLARNLAVIVMADRVLAPGPETEALDQWVRHGGMLIRFAGPQFANTEAEADPLLPAPLLGHDRALGGAMSWSQPAGLAPFPANSIFAGLTVPPEVTIDRQVLAAPSAQLAARSWASLTDGTPLVTQAAHGDGQVVLFHVTANADWSNLPLSGLFVAMLNRLVARSAGVATAADAETRLAPAEALDGYGTLGPPPLSATSLQVGELSRTIPSPAHPPGLYGPATDRHAFNLGPALPPLVTAPSITGAATRDLGAVTAERKLGPALLAAAILLLVLDLVFSLFWRGLLRRRVIAAAAVALLLLGATGAARALETGVPPALMPRLAAIESGDPQVDSVSRAGLEGLSDYVNSRTAATLAEPDMVTPGTTDLSFYPLLYWPITGQAAPFSAAGVKALNDYMDRGGILLVDTRGSDVGQDGSGAGFAPDATAALQRATAGLSIPALVPLGTDHVLARSFYLLQDFPGRFAGAPVWVQRDQDRGNDSVSPVIIGANDWASAWAIDGQGHPMFATVPGGARQRVLAYRFGVNLVMYAFTGNYKGDQVHIPTILERLGQ